MHSVSRCFLSLTPQLRLSSGYSLQVVDAGEILHSSVTCTGTWSGVGGGWECLLILSLPDRPGSFEDSSRAILTGVVWEGGWCWRGGWWKNEKELFLKLSLGFVGGGEEREARAALSCFNGSRESHLL